MKTSKRLVSMVLCMVMLICTLSVSAATVNYGAELTDMPTKSYVQTFTDVPKSYWAFSYIGEMVDRGVLNGYPDGKFYPDNNVSREEFAKIMTVAASLPITTVGESEYADVTCDSWAHPYIQAAKYYLGGFMSNGMRYYRPETNALREDIAVALVKLKGYSTTGYDLSMIKTMFSDWQSISTSAQPYVATAVEKGLISGYEDGTFKGQQGITRAEAATLLWRAYQYGDDNKVYEPEVIEPPVTTTTQPVETKKPAVKEDEKKEDTKPVYKNDDNNDDELDDDDHVYEEDTNMTDEDLEPEPEKEYGWELTTVRSGIDDILIGQAVPNGFSYMKSCEDGKIYEVNDSGKITIIFDSSAIGTWLLSYAYNKYDNNYYALVVQGSNEYMLYNVTNSEVICNVDEIAKHSRDYGWIIEYYTKHSQKTIHPYINFYKNGDYLISYGYNTIISCYGTFVDNIRIDDETQWLLYGNEIIVFDRNADCIIGSDKFYYISHDKILYDNGSDTGLLLSIDDISNEEERRFNIDDVISNGAISDDESKIYFYDHGYGTIRKIERKK